jgi:nitrite reductase/ring-hydroxylating ferredoxin subunit
MSEACAPPPGASRRTFVACIAGTLAAEALSQAWGGIPVRWIESVATATERRYPVPPADSVNIDRQASVIVVRADGHAFAFSLACPHESAAVKWVDKDRRFQCTKHDSRYQADGEHIAGRATRNLDRFPIRREGATLVVTTDGTFHSDTDPKGWAAASADLS